MQGVENCYLWWLDKPERGRRDTNPRFDAKGSTSGPLTISVWYTGKKHTIISCFVESPNTSITIFNLLIGEVDGGIQCRRLVPAQSEESIVTWSSNTKYMKFVECKMCTLASLFCLTRSSFWNVSYIKCMIYKKQSRAPLRFHLARVVYGIFVRTADDDSAIFDNLYWFYLATQKTTQLYAPRTGREEHEGASTLL